MNSLPGRPTPSFPEPSDDGMGFIMGGTGIAALVAIFGGSYLVYKVASYFTKSDDGIKAPGTLEKAFNLVPYIGGGLGLGYLAKMAPEESKTRKYATLGAIGVTGYGLAKMVYPEVVKKALAVVAEPNIWQNTIEKGIKVPDKYAALSKNTTLKLSTALKEDASGIKINVFIQNKETPAGGIVKPRFYVIRLIMLSTVTGQKTTAEVVGKIDTPGLKPGGYDVFQWTIDKVKYPNANIVIAAIAYPKEDTNSPLVMDKTTIGPDLLNLLVYN